VPLKEWTRDDLVEAFRSLGADDPARWASSQLSEGVPQLHRFAFLRALWSHVVTPAETAWVDTTIAEAERSPGEPVAAAAAAIDQMLKAGVSRDDVVSVVRAAQCELVFAVAHQIDDCDFAVARLPYGGDPADIGWGLFAVDEDGNPQTPIDGLHESVTEVAAPAKG
jgi:hypothetical protein